VLQPVGKELGLDFGSCEKCGHSTEEHIYLQDSVWECKECGKKCNNEKSLVNDLFYSFLK
jgi:ribosomal protein L37AE/L43A